jgi:hypothetical protein
MKRPILDDSESTNIMNQLRECKDPRARAVVYTLARLTRALEKLRFELQTLTYFVSKEGP